MADRAFYVLSPGTDAGEWREAWARLARLVAPGFAPTPTGPPEAGVCPRCGEGWQHMGSVNVGPGDAWRHEFRHRCGIGAALRPFSGPCGERIYLAVPASPGWKPEEVPAT